MRHISYLRFVGIRSVIIMSALAVILASSLVSANLIGPRPSPDTTFRLNDPVSGIAWLFFVNLLVNFACYCGVLLAFAKKYIGADDLLRTTGLRFLGAIVCVVVAITAVGAFIDFYLVAQPRYIDSIYNAIGDDISGTYRVLVFDVVVWTLALALIIASIVIASILMLRMSRKPSVVVAVSMAILNLLAWLLIGFLGEDIVFLSIFFGMLLAPVLVSLLIRWYAAGMPGTETPHAA